MDKSTRPNSLFSKITKPSQEVPSLGIDDGEFIDVQSIVASTGTISVFDDTESAFNEAKSISMESSMESSMQGSLIQPSSLQGSLMGPSSLRSSRQSLHSPRQSLNRTVQSLNSIHSINDEDDKANDESKRMKSEEDKIKEQELRKKEKILCKVQYGMYILLSMFCAFTVMIIWYTSWLGENSITNEIDDKQSDINANSNNSTCQFWHIVGDGFCDDEANIVECGYDLKDCCEMGNDRTLCEDCFCFIPEADKASIEEKYLEKCSLFIPQYLGRGNCDLNMNNVENYFDLGDCCLEDVSCRIKFFNETDYVTKYCPENPCIRSNIFCVQEELGNGLCEDHNNSPYCDYDLGDCCIYGQNYGPPTSTRHPSKIDCCECACKQTPLHPANMNLG